MKKRLFAWPALLAILWLPLLAACGSNVSRLSGFTTQPVYTGSELYVLDNYTGAGQSSVARHIVVLPMGTTHPAARLTLPAGLTDLKHRWLYMASSLSGASTHISVLDTHSGALVHAFSIPGSYSTADQGLADSMLSGDGRWLALRDQHVPAGTTGIVLVDTQTGKLVKSIQLAGDFTLDAVSPKGTLLYLLEYYQAGTSHYHVRAYDVQSGQLLQGDIADKTELDEKMEGSYLTRWMSGAGDMAYTLYINPITNKAFIHILWLADTIAGSPFPMIARCIDLPVGNSAALLSYYTLALSRDGQTLYAVNAALGLIASVDLGPGVSSYQPWMIPNAKTARFTPDQSTPTSAGQERDLYHAAVLSPDQRLLYVAGPRGIQVINTSTLRVQAEYLSQQSFTGLAISSSGQTLYAVDPASGITLLDPASGQVRSVIQGSVQAPWGIAWAT